mmetsp:Transcript_939/g.3931  ORF Transcript_939/g.3931 Transcript_939/m.3931 type:complete len:228 (+) Transcript_939:880-1563(+)
MRSSRRLLWSTMKSPTTHCQAVGAGTTRRTGNESHSTAWAWGQHPSWAGRGEHHPSHVRQTVKWACIAVHIFSRSRRRFSRPRSLSDYKLWVALLEEQGMDVAGRLAEDGEDVPDHSEETDAFLEEVMLGLRTKDGIDMEELAQKYGEDCAEQLRGILQPVEHVRIEGKRIGLVAPEGFLLSNDIISTVFAEVDDMGAARSTQRPPCVPVADGPCSGQEAHLEKGAG